MVLKEYKAMVMETLLRSNAPKEIIRQVAQVPIRKSKTEAPPGGISLSEASRKYGIPHPTLSRWTKRGYIPVLLRTPKELFVSEVKLVELVNIYKQDPGQGKRIIKSMKCRD